MFDGDAELILVQVTIERYQNRFRIRRKLILDNTGQCGRALPLAALGESMISAIARAHGKCSWRQVPRGGLEPQQ